MIDNWAQGYVQYSQLETSLRNRECDQELETNNDADGSKSNFEFLKTLNKYDQNSSQSSMNSYNIQLEVTTHTNNTMLKTLAAKMGSATKPANKKITKSLDRMKVSNSSDLNAATVSNNDTAKSRDSTSLHRTTRVRCKTEKASQLKEEQRSRDKILIDMMENEEENDDEFCADLDQTEATRADNKSVTSSEIKRLEEPISKAPLACQSLLKSILNKNVALREIEIDAAGQIQSISKFDFDKLAPKK